MERLFEELELDEIDEHRRESCESYESCLTIAAMLNWQSFTCVDCENYIERELLIETPSAQEGNAYPDASGPPIGPDERKKMANAMRKMGIDIWSDNGK